MDPRDLKAASKYINNLLSSRGLLHGKEIPFHKPTDDETTPSKIINLVHELLARRDKEEETRESLALTLRTLRSTETTQAAAVALLKTKTADLERKNAILESAARSHTATLRTVEAANRTLKDEITRIKTTLSQVRTQCANDIRKRDVQIQKMKERLSDTRGRGSRAPMAQCTVIGGPPTNSLASSRGATTTEDEDRRVLVQDTTDFLTKLSQDLADENDNLIALLRTTLSTLKAIQGLPDDTEHFLPGNAEDEENLVVAPPAGFEDLTAELDATLYTLKGVLNQPNYVPVEELAERDAEVERLGARNKVLEEEWRKALELVDGWNKTLGKRFEEATREEEEGRTPGGSQGRALVELVGQVREAEVETEVEVEVEVGWRGKELSMVEEEVVVEEVVQKTPAKKRRKSHISGPTMEAAVEKEEIPEIQHPPFKKDRKQKTKASKSGLEERAEEAAEEAAVEEQILAEVHATPVKTPAKIPAKATAKSQKSKRKVRISEAAPEMFEPEEIPMEVEEEALVEVAHTLVGKERRRKSTKKGIQPEVAHEEVQVAVVAQKGEIMEKSPVKKDKKKPSTHEGIKETVTAEPAQTSLRKRKAPKDTMEVIGDLIIHEGDVLGGRESKKRARKEDIIMEVEVQTSGVAQEEVPRERGGGGRARKENMSIDVDTTGMADATETAEDEEAVSEGLVLKKGERKRRASRMRTDMDELLEQALSAVEPIQEPEIVEEQIQEPLKGKERKPRASRARKEDESMAEDTFARLTTRDEPIVAEKEMPAKKPRRSRPRGRKDLNEDSVMLDELAMEPVPVMYEEIVNEVQVVCVKDEENKPNRVRRRSLRNRDKHPVTSKIAPESPKRPSSERRGIRKSSRKRGSSFTVGGLNGPVNEM